ncbi:IclR family transcriptional regulator [Rhodococcus ruber]|uniref:IclR family transcriptional regulator n=1 Tax=Rhodococcus TaxID=1827 RepID=UPI0007CD4EC3|nr:IclR family transcriptional regulator [Rhodococcus ruber]AWG98279.1 IclR family transcriptional regulator [Rhodococcus ruber]MDO2379347.1 IclR family transcriptional regulator [Rhodococcus ruber]RIK11300.1 MAG: IclR family transcriptional regulator [Acidobacteriota bacterium]RQM33888.1 IclR family transcriptional regulator [Rhodococcus ruber]
MASLQTVQRIGPVLDLFTVQQPEWGVSEVAAAIDVPRSSAHALLSSLVDTGLLQCRVRGRYRLGWRVVELGETLRGTVDVRSCAAPVLERLVEKYGETTHLAVMDRWNVLYVDKILGNHNITVQGARVGTRLDAHSTAVGKVLLAQLEEIEVRRYLAMRPLRRLTPSTTTNPQALLDALAGVRSAGFAADLGETVSEVHCVAAPVRDDLGSVVAAVSVSVPATRFAQRRPQLERAVVGAAHEITRAIAEAHDCSPVPLRDDPSAAALVEASPRAS